MSCRPPLPDVSVETQLTRFVSDSKLIRAEKTPRVKPKVFLPRHDEKTGELSLSTFQLSEVSEEGFRVFGRRWAMRFHGSPERLKASCHLPAQDYERARMRLDADNDPFRHVNVFGWPLEDADQLEIANELCRLVEERGSLREYR